MSTSYFKTASPKFGQSNTGLEARALGAGGYASRGASIGQQKTLGVAAALNKSKFKPQKTDSAYAKGPKL